jgi:putative transposase
MRIFGYVVMPEHVHILVSEPERDTLPTAIQSLKLSVAKLAKRSKEMDGPARFWQKRYYDFNVKDHEQFVEKLRYIHRNPVKRGIVEKPEDWEWSSFCHYSTGVPDLVEIESEWMARQRLEVLPEKSPR